MLKIGIVCSREKDAGEIAQAARLAAAREGLICEVCVIQGIISGRMPGPGKSRGRTSEKSCERTPGKSRGRTSEECRGSKQEEFLETELEGIQEGEPDTFPWESLKGPGGPSCVILSWKCRQEAFAWAEKAWGQDPGLLLLYVAHSAEDIFAALQMPFFHTVRAFGLEQDLGTAFRKLGRLKVPSAEKTGFTWGGKVMHIYRRDILYLESEHHDIRLHTLGEVLPVTESLSQCEQKLRNQGFVRIHRSFLVNMYHVRCLEKGNVLLDNGERLYVSRQRYPEVKFQFENYIRHLDFI